MSSAADAPPSLTRRALRMIEQLEAQLAAAERDRHAPIAVIGLACRYPGAGDPEALWALLRDHGDAITEVPADRWNVDATYDPRPGVPGKTYARHGGFLADLRGFDAHFFGISPREAISMDPQQRLLLELSHEAIEHAGLPAERVSGSRTGVFFGIIKSEYADLLSDRGDLDLHAITGNSLNAAAGRVAYALGLQGPSLAIDTACSSSLVAIHQACRSLRAGDCTMALAGGVSVILTPRGAIALSQAGALAPDGRCKAFDARADGFVRSEGCGIVALKRLADALADGDRVLAVLRGSSVNQDGRSSGLTVPNGPAQEQVIRQALDDAGLTPADIDYIEAHGTGTPLGDPIEAGALGAVFGAQTRPAGAPPLVLGSVKTNIGHTEAAAGVAGLLKVVLALQHEQIPPHLHFERPSPHIDWSALPFEVPTRPLPWPRGPRPRRAGVSSFGISGTNAHLVVEEAPEPALDATTTSSSTAPPHLLLLSARSEAALAELAHRYARALTSGQLATVPLATVCAAAARRRSLMEHRLAVLADDPAQLAARLLGHDPDHRFSGSARGPRPRLVFVFPGQGSQWPGMGRDLLAREPVFRAAILRIDAAFAPFLGWSLADMLARGPLDHELARIDIVQPLLGAFQIALADLWRAHGLTPDLVLGHSMGEVAAAVVAGALSLHDAARVLSTRSRLLRLRSGHGAMALVELDLDHALAAIAPFPSLSVAACNAPNACVLAGEPHDLDLLLQQLSARDIFSRLVRVDVASHSPLMDPVCAELEPLLADLRPLPLSLPMLSTVSVEFLAGPDLDARYWLRNLRDTVLFSPAVQRLLLDGPCLFLELSPHPVLLPFLQPSLPPSSLALPSLRRDLDHRPLLLSSLAALFSRGLSLHLPTLFPSSPSSLLLPPYPWQHEPFWLPPTSTHSPSTLPPSNLPPSSHPLLGAPLSLALLPHTLLWQAHLSLSAAPFLSQHRVHARLTLPAAAFLDLALSAARTHWPDLPLLLTRANFLHPLFLPHHLLLQTSLACDPRRADFSIASRDPSDPSLPWTIHTTGTLQVAAEHTTPAALEPLDEIRARCPELIAPDEHHRRLHARGIELDAAFRTTLELRRGEREVLAHLKLSAELIPDAPRHVIHPALLDGCLQALAALATDADLYFPARLERMWVPAPATPPTELWVHLRSHAGPGADAIACDILVRDADGPRLELLGLHVRRLELAALPLPAAPTRIEPGLDEALRASRSDDERRATLEGHIRREVAAVLKLAPDRVPRLEPIAALGLDSVMAIELRNRLARGLGLALPATLLWAHPTVAALATHLGELLDLHLGAAPAADAVPRPSQRASVADVDEPIAIIGMACRFPGARTPAAFWELLRDGRDAIRSVPADRWDVDTFYDPDPAAPGKIATRWAGFLDDVDRFDPDFFGVSRREAIAMDPQQRLFLEVAWEALECAGQAPDALAGSPTGVFVGVCTSDYFLLQTDDRAAIDAYGSTGCAMTIIANRLSYLLDLRGPSMAVDSACSSSLVALHLAANSLRRGETDLAVAGGVNLILTPELSIALSKWGVMAPDGRCKAFDASADGFVRGEGCGVLVLKRMRDALADGDEILALVRGSAVNQDGRSAGLTAPNQGAQEAVVRQALAAADAAPADISFLEAHGTGTALGDPIELEALAAVFGRRAGAQTCALGATKTNVGHLEAAAGVCSLIKVVLAMQHRAVPPIVHFKALNPKASLAGTPFYVPTALTPWSSPGGPRLAGISAFGMGGTNAHVILEEAPERTRTPAQPTRSDVVLTLSGHTPEALRALARAYREHIAAGAPADLPDLCYTAAVRRAHHEHRLVVTADTPRLLLERIDHFLAGRAAPGLCVGRKPVAEWRRIVFVCSPHGSQWRGMGRSLLAAEPVFAAAFDRCDAAVRAIAGWSPRACIDDADDAWMDRIDRLHPTLFALQVALAALWRDRGIEPSAVVGHSVGEVAAAHIAGALTLADAARVVCGRSELLARTAGQGAMAFVELSMADACRAIAGYEPRLGIGASNSPRFTVISGERAALDDLLRSLTRQGIFCGAGVADVASHTPQMAGLQDSLRATLAPIEPRATTLTLVSSCAGAPIDGAALGPDYWARHISEPVLFWPALAGLLALDHDVFIELAPHPVLAPFISEALAHQGRQGTVLPSMRRGESGPAVMLESFGALHALGHPVAWRRIYPTGRLVPTPAYPFQRTRHWVEPAPPQPHTRALPTREHPLLGARLPAPLVSGAHLWRGELAVADAPWLRDHRVGGVILVPGAAILEMALTAARHAFACDDPILEDARFEQAFVLPDDGARRVQLTLTPDPNGGATFELHSAAASELRCTWKRHARGHLRLALRDDPPPPTDLDAVRRRCPEQLAGSALYEAMARRAIAFGPAFQALVRAACGPGEALGELHPPAEVVADRAPFAIHPALLDAACQGVAAALAPDDPRRAAERTYLPISVAHVRVLRPIPPGPLVSHIRLRPRTDGLEGSIDADIDILDPAGEHLVTLQGFHAEPLDAADRGGNLGDDWLYDVVWRPVPPGAPGQPVGRWLFIADAGGLARELAASLSALGEACELVPAETPDAALRQHIDAALRAGPRAVVYLRGLDVPPTADLDAARLHAAGARTCEGLLTLVQALAAADAADPPRLWIVTRGAQPVAPGPVALAQAPLWGLARSISHELPELACTALDLDPAAPPDELRTLLHELTAAEREDQRAHRGDQRFVARLVPASLPRDPDLAAPIRPDATYLLIGGLGGLGLAVARSLVERGARHLVLVGRSGAPTTAAPHLATMARTGAQVRVVQADVARLDELQALCADITRTMPPLRGVLHAAVVLDDGVLTSQTPERFRRVAAAKVEGAWNLHVATLAAPLEFFVLFSSAASILGSPGQGNYAAANSFLDALAHHRRALGLPATSINWGPWADIGLAAAQANRGARLALSGFASIEPEQGLDLLARVLRGAPPQLAIMPIRVADWRRYYPQAAASPLLSELLSSEDLPAVAAPIEALRQAPANDRPALLRALLTAIVAQVMRLAEPHLDPDRPLGTLGFDSLMAVELRNRLEAALGLRLQATLIWSYPTVNALTGHLLTRLDLAPEPPPPAADDDLLRLLDAVDALTDADLGALLDSSS